MDIKGLCKKSSIPLTLFLSSLMSFYLLIKLLGYTFIPFNGIVINFFTAGIIIWLTIIGMKNRNEKTNISVVSTVFLPLIAISYLILKSISCDISGKNHGLLLVYLTGENTMIYVIHACITLACSMILFFSCGRGKAARIGVGIIYCILLFFMCVIFFFAIVLSDFGKNTLVKSELSPNSKYLAEVIAMDSGALGGDTVVNVTRQNRDINLFFGELKKDPKRIYHGRWGEFYDMTLRWETDEVLYIDGTRYLVE